MTPTSDLRSPYTKSTRRRIFTEHEKPRRIKGATWQAGVTRGNYDLRPFLNGEPLADAFAASDRKAWCRVFATKQPPRVVVRTGYIELRPVPPMYR